MKAENPKPPEPYQQDWLEKGAVAFAEILAAKYPDRRFTVRVDRSKA